MQTTSRGTKTKLKRYDALKLVQHRRIEYQQQDTTRNSSTLSTCALMPVLVREVFQGLIAAADVPAEFLSLKALGSN